MQGLSRKGKVTSFPSNYWINSRRIIRIRYMIKNVLALILAGGRVDELDVLTFFRPKSMVPFGGLYRIIDFPLTNLVRSGIEKVGIFSQYRPRDLIDHISNGAPWDMVGRNRFITILPPFKGREMSDWYQGTADAVHQNLDFIRLNNPELVLILSGDHIYKMDYGNLIRFHLDHGADLTIGLVRVPREGAHRFGLARLAEEAPEGGRILEYAEKPDNPLFHWASLTIYLFKPEVLIDALLANAGRESNKFGRDIIPDLVAHRRVYGYTHQGYWGYTRTPLEYWQANMDLLGRNPRLDVRPWEIITNLAHHDIRDKRPAFLGETADVQNTLFYSGCVIKGKVRNSILFPGVRVEEGAHVEDSILFFDTVVGGHAKIAKTIADTNVIVGKGVEIGEAASRELTIIGKNAEIPEGVALARGVTVETGPQGRGVHKVKILVR